MCNKELCNNNVINCSDRKYKKKGEELNTTFSVSLFDHSSAILNVKPSHVVDENCSVGCELEVKAFILTDIAPPTVINGFNFAKLLRKK